MEVEEQIMMYIRGEAGLILALSPEVLEPDAPLVEYGLDSVRAMELVAGIEDTFDIEIDEFEIATLRTIADLVVCVQQKQLECVV